jgi:hypothetical protein
MAAAPGAIVKEGERGAGADNEEVFEIREYDMVRAGVKEEEVRQELDGEVSRGGRRVAGDVRESMRVSGRGGGGKKERRKKLTKIIRTDEKVTKKLFLTSAINKKISDERLNEWTRKIFYNYRS